MAERSRRSRVRRAGAWIGLLTALAVAAGVIALAGCGSSQPAYCADGTNLQSSVKGLNVSGGVSGLKSQAEEIQSDAAAVVSPDKSDATVTKDAAGVVSWVKTFMNASNSKCS